MDQYWASVSKAEIGAEIFTRVEAQRNYLVSTKMLSAMRKSYDTYYFDPEIVDVDQSLKAIHVNHYASYIRNIHNMVTSSRPAWEPQAINTDLETQADTTLASGLLDYYMREKQIETKLTEAVLNALFLKEAWISLGWNATGGAEYGVNPDTQQPIFEGDFEVKTYLLTDITRDIKRKDMNHKWYIVRDMENKWDLAAKYPEFAGKIAALTFDSKDLNQYEIESSSTIDNTVDSDDDLIPVYTLFHDKTDALKTGRMAIVLSDEICVFDGPLPYKNLYLFPITTGKKTKTGFGHSYMMDLLPVNDAFDATVSAILTNQAANAVQNFQVPKGASPTINKLQGGMNVIEYDPKAGKIERLDLLGTAPEVFNFANFMLQQGDLISNVSQIGRGDAPANMSGTAMALLQQQAIMSTSGVQTSYTLAVENVGTALIELLQTFAVVPRLALIAGKSKRSMMKQFSNKDLKGIGRVMVNRANPLMKTGAGRMEVANNLLGMEGMITTPEQYLGVLTTGSLDPLTQRDNSQRMFILSENEMLMEGKPVQVVLTDDHPEHVLEHSCVLDSPEARENPTVLKATLDHIQQHIDIAKSMAPEMAQMLKQQSFFAQPPPPPEGAQPQGPGGPAPGAPLPGPDQMMPMNGLPPESALPKPAEPPNPNAFPQGV